MKPDASPQCLRAATPPWRDDGWLWSLAFCALFTMAYHLWWPAIFIAIAPLAILHAGSVGFRPWLGFCQTWLGAAGAWLAVYHFFGTYTVKGLIVLAIAHGFIAAFFAALAGLTYRRTRVPFTLVLPVFWVAGEWVRMSGPTGLPVGLLAPVCHEQLWMIQTADLTGIYGLSFALAMVNGLAADFYLRQRKTRSANRDLPDHGRALLTPVWVTSAVWCFLAVYGHFRLFQTRETRREGPLVTVVQPDVPGSSETELGFDPDLHLEEMLRLSNESLHRTPEQDLIVWPEAMAAMPPLNSEFLAPPAHLFDGIPRFSVRPAGAITGP